MKFSGPSEDFMPVITTMMAKYGPAVRFHLGTRVNLAVSTPDAFEKILSSNKQITKVTLDMFYLRLGETPGVVRGRKKF